MAFSRKAKPNIFELPTAKNDVKKVHLGLNCETLKRFETLQENCENFLAGPLKEPYRYHFRVPGKMIRAQLAYQSAILYSASEADADRWGFAVELIHNASLIHDDICDSDLLRRGRQSVLAKYGHQTALCLGDALIAHAFGLLSRESIPRVLIAKLASMVRDCSGGQAQEFDTRGYPDWSRYCEIAGGKTASLLAGAVEGGALFDPTANDNLMRSRCCHQLALVYQMLNDTRNIVTPRDSKTPSSDFLNCRPNVVIVLFRDSLSAAERKGFDVSLDGKMQADKSFDTMAENSWWERLVTSDIGKTVEDKIASIMRDTESNFARLSPAMQQIISPLLTHATEAVAEQNLALIRQSAPYAKNQNG